ALSQWITQGGRTHDEKSPSFRKWMTVKRINLTRFCVGRPGKLISVETFARLNRSRNFKILSGHRSARTRVGYSILPDTNRDINIWQTTARRKVQLHKAVADDRLDLFVNARVLLRRFCTLSQLILE